MDNSLVREEVIKTKATENLKYKKKLRTAQKVNAWAARVVLIFVCLITLFPIIATILGLSGSSNLNHSESSFIGLSIRKQDIDDILLCLFLFVLSKTGGISPIKTRSCG